MIQFPKGLVPTKFTGYYWHVENRELYWINNGVLEQLMPPSGRRAYKIRGGHRTMSIPYLESLTLNDEVHELKTKFMNSNSSAVIQMVDYNN